jgi:hypothetical protein
MQITNTLAQNADYRILWIPNCADFIHWISETLFLDEYFIAAQGETALKPSARQEFLDRIYDYRTQGSRM